MSKISEEKKQEYEYQYQYMVNKVNPKPPLLKNCIWAFLVGGVICVIGQAINNIFLLYGLAKDDAAMWTSVTLVFAGALLTGLDIYDSIGKYAGAGSIVPITGFSNSIVSPAMEYKKEGYVFGVGAKMFTIAGPVIVYGVIASVIVGLIYYFI